MDKKLLKEYFATTGYEIEGNYKVHVATLIEHFYIWLKNKGHVKKENK